MSVATPIPIAVFARDSGLKKFEVMPGGGAANGIDDKTVRGDREAIFADQNSADIPMITQIVNNRIV